MEHLCVYEAFFRMFRFKISTLDLLQVDRVYPLTLKLFMNALEVLSCDSNVSRYA